jgi:hypothetical protein
MYNEPMVWVSNAHVVLCQVALSSFEDPLGPTYGFSCVLLNYNTNTPTAWMKTAAEFTRKHKS